MSHGEWYLNFDGRQTAEENMAADSALLADCEQGLIPPTVRFYGWSEPAITLGYSQKAEAELDHDRCRELAIPVVRRPTGGRALLHYNELTYAVVAPVTRAPFNRGLKATFEAISEALLSGLKGLGVRGDLNTRRQRPASEFKRSPACFASLNHCEITVDGKKLVGSAQKRTSKAFLQHGSVIIESDHELFTSLLQFDGEQQRSETRHRLMEATTSLNRVCGRALTLEEVYAALQEGFQKALGGVWLPAERSHPPATSGKVHVS
ncbi:MAG: lipoate--protein ligase family protein [Nitrospinae bacterium]|nr:lipoate--protein ligase family protein [Nitrospinota bacterium]